MDPRELFIDERLRGVCAHCGAEADSRDHVPSRVLLDEPYPPNLPIAESCTKCNRSFSADETYTACLMECVIRGTVIPNEKFRPQVARILKSRPLIGGLIAKGKSIDGRGNIVWDIDHGRVRNVVLKLARGHMSYELGIQCLRDPLAVDIMPIPLMTSEELEIFNSADGNGRLLWPEAGSRAFINVIKARPTAYGQWEVVQEGRYRYAVGQSSECWVKFVLSEYLACKVTWD